MGHTSMRKLSSKEAAEIGATGGRAGIGDAKRRSKAHYKRMVEIRRANRTGILTPVLKKRIVKVKKAK